VSGPNATAEKLAFSYGMARYEFLSQVSWKSNESNLLSLVHYLKFFLIFSEVDVDFFLFIFYSDSCHILFESGVKLFVMLMTCII
jgi:hypothetical protein